MSKPGEPTVAREPGKPVIDLAERIDVTAHEVPDRLSEQVRLRDQRCAAPAD
ncbi:hypothetical protein QWY28_02935 [Nocardioides sp. SOB77]|uniref:Uncharacterized protein n=1 Tax=Nocardioides oceani TaxID=3058369 RepID=A0ABT8FB61_9ACTN|nr:hypothetical protein [Nocardioides oceani]MDN4171891.1 hypothetical protein [Nocardioides oceani]